MTSSRKLPVAERHLPALQQLAAFDEPTVGAIASQLEKQPEGSLSAKLAISLVPVPFEDVDEARALVDALVSLSLWRSALRLTLLDVAETVAATSELSLGDDARKRFEGVISRLLSLGTVWHLAKAYDLATAFNKSVRTCRIITDIRPVFEDDPSVKPVTAIISHSLELRSYAADGETKTYYFALDAIDLRHLHEWTERAIEKAKTAESLLAEQGLGVHHLEES